MHNCLRITDKINQNTSALLLSLMKFMQLVGQFNKEDLVGNLILKISNNNTIKPR